MGVNNPTSLVADKDLFGMSLAYEDNGNIKNQTYSNAQTKKINNIWTFETRPVYSYDFANDKLSRLLNANLKVGNTSTFASTYAYDINGNILNLTRSFNGTTVDK